MRRSTMKLAVAIASTVMIFVPGVLVAAPEHGIGEMLKATKTTAPDTRQASFVPTQAEEVAASSSDEFVLGVRNRSDRERAGSSTAAGAEEPSSAHVTPYRSEPDYGISEWWGEASQTKKTATIVGGAVVFLIIFAG